MYEDFCLETKAGSHGVNSQYWLNYVNVIDLYLLMSRAVRTCDVDLFIYSLGEMNNVFFAANRHNYARYMTSYQQKLINIDSTHPGLKKTI